MTMHDVKTADYLLRVLRRISKTVHALDEAACNYELSKRQQTRRVNLLNQASLTASDLGLRIYHQSDPRGCSLYLYDPKDLNGSSIDSYYSSIGLAL